MEYLYFYNVHSPTPSILRKYFRNLSISHIIIFIDMVIFTHHSWGFWCGGLFIIICFNLYSVQYLGGTMAIFFAFWSLYMAVSSYTFLNIHDAHLRDIGISCGIDGHLIFTPHILYLLHFRAYLVVWTTQPSINIIVYVMWLWWYSSGGKPP